MKKSLVVVFLLILAGCSGGEVTPTANSPTPSTTSDPIQSTATQPPTDSPTATITPTTTSTPTPTATPLPDAAYNPWQKQPVTVAIVKDHDESRNFEPHVRQGLNFWEQNATKSTPFGIKYRLINDSEQADIVLRFVKDIPRCGFEADKDTIGCAPVLTSVGAAKEQTEVRIETGYDNESTTTIIKHELGHTLGLGHEDNDSHWFMAARISVGTFPQPDVDERDWKWDSTEVRVYANVSEAADHRHDKLRQEIQEMVWTYNDYDHRDIPDNVSVRMVDNSEDANVIVKIVDETPNGEYSDGWIVPDDPDKDGETEYYVGATIYIRDAYHDDVEQYAGNWLGWILYADDDRDLPQLYRSEHLDPH